MELSDSTIHGASVGAPRVRSCCIRQGPPPMNEAHQGPSRPWLTGPNHRGYPSIKGFDIPLESEPVLRVALKHGRPRLERASCKEFNESCPFSRRGSESPAPGREVGDDRRMGEWRGSSKRVLAWIAKSVIHALTHFVHIVGGISSKLTSTR